MEFPLDVLQVGSTVKTATVRELRNHYTSVMKWIEAVGAGGKIGTRIVRSGRSLTARRSMPEMALAGENHGNATLVCGGDDLRSLTLPPG